VEAWSSPEALKKCGSSEKVTNDDGNLKNPNDPSVLWNGMITPLLNVSIAGAVWYQGESNANSNNYNCTFPTMVDDWRNKWNLYSGGGTKSNFPFGFVQLSTYPATAPIDGFVTIRWAQTANYGYVPNTREQNYFMAVAMDLGDMASPEGGIHPRYKQDVGYRLSLGALAIAYGYKDVVYSGPLINSITQVQDHTGAYTLTAKYRSVGAQGIILLTSTGFEVGTSDGKWYDTVSGLAASDTIQLTGTVSGKITQVRYAWRVIPCDYKQCPVYSALERLPSPPFIYTL
jgi:sialate O-acetylesterase